MAGKTRRRTKAKVSRGPDWTKDEWLLVLETYLKHAEKVARSRSKKKKNWRPPAIDRSHLADELNALNSAGSKSKLRVERNQSSVDQQISCLIGLDERNDDSHENIGAVGRLVWNEYWNSGKPDLEKLAKKCQAVRRKIKSDVKQLLVQSAEGGKSRYMRTIIDRDLNTALNKKRQNRDKNNGHLKCHVCGFDFAEKYGGIGEGYIEVHHEKPLAGRKRARKTVMSELECLCANCHAMAHYNHDCRPVSSIKRAIKKQKDAKSF